MHFATGCVMNKENTEFGDAYQGARGDLAIWKRRALEAEGKVREQDQIIDRLGAALNEENGPSFMGEPAMTANQTIDGVLVSRELAKRLAVPMLRTSEYLLDHRDALDELRALLDADKVNNRQMGLMQFVEAHPIKPTGLSQGWNLTRKHDGFVVGHQSVAYPPDGKAIERAERDGYVWVPFLLPAAQPQGEPVAWVECSPAWLKAGGDCATAPRLCIGRDGISHLHPARAEQPAPVAVVLPDQKTVSALVTKAARQADLIHGANYFTAAEIAAESVIDELKRLNPSL